MTASIMNSKSKKQKAKSKSASPLATLGPSFVLISAFCFLLFAF